MAHLIAVFALIIHSHGVWKEIKRRA